MLPDNITSWSWDSVHAAFRGGESKIPAFLSDHAFLAYALLDLYEATFDLRWFGEAQAVVAQMNERFWDDAEGGYHWKAGVARPGEEATQAS